MKGGVPPGAEGHRKRRLETIQDLCACQVNWRQSQSGITPIRENVLALLIGGLAFGERQTARQIAPGACVMLAGMVLLSLAG